MARGKHAVLAARQRVEARDDHIDRLVDQLAEARIVAKQHRYDASLRPTLEAEVHRLRNLIDAGTSEALESEREKRIEQGRVNEEVLYEVGGILSRMCDSFGDTPLFTMSEWDILEKVFGAHIKGVRLNRHSRRQRVGNVTAFLNQCNPRQLDLLGFSRLNPRLKTYYTRTQFVGNPEALLPGRPPRETAEGDTTSSTPANVGAIDDTGIFHNQARHQYEAYLKGEPLGSIDDAEPGAVVELLRSFEPEVSSRIVGAMQIQQFRDRILAEIQEQYVGDQETLAALVRQIGEMDTNIEPS